MLNRLSSHRLARHENAIMADVPLSALKPQEFIDGVKPILEKLAAAGVNLTGIQLGNEINLWGFSGENLLHQAAGTLGLGDFNNPNDAAARPIAPAFASMGKSRRRSSCWRSLGGRFAHAR
jgi:hypothetical protein